MIRIIDIGRVKSHVREFLTRVPDTPVVVSWDQELKVLDVNAAGHGMELRLGTEVVNTDGDYMTDEEKQEIVDKVQTIVDEHNNNITE